MSNSLAIATVTRALQQVVEAAAASVVSGVQVRMSRPEATTGTEARVHLFLYQVLPDSAQRNQDLPSRTAEGLVRQKPAAALTLRYLLTFIGDDVESDPHKMLAAVVRDLHARPNLNRALVQAVSVGDLAASDLAQAHDLVRVTPLALNTDELSKLWLMFSQIPYSLSVAYEARVVLIEAEETSTPAPPVLSRGKDDRGVETLLGPFPALESFEISQPNAPLSGSRLPSYPAAQLGLRVVLRGRNLGGDSVVVRFTHPRLGDLDVTVPPADRTAEQVLVTIPNDGAAQTAWAAGMYMVSVRTARGSVIRASNVVAMPFAPAFSAIAPASPVAGAGTDLALTVTCSPQIAAGQRAEFRVAGVEDSLELTSASASVTFTLRDAPAVTDELAYLRVDGVDSFVFVQQPGPPPKFVIDPSKRITIT